MPAAGEGILAPGSMAGEDAVLDGRTASAVPSTVPQRMKQRHCRAVSAAQAYRGGSAVVRGRTTTGGARNLGNSSSSSCAVDW